MNSHVSSITSKKNLQRKLYAVREAADQKTMSRATTANPKPMYVCMCVCMYVCIVCGLKKPVDTLVQCEPTLVGRGCYSATVCIAPASIAVTQAKHSKIRKIRNEYTNFARKVVGGGQDEPYKFARFCLTRPSPGFGSPRNRRSKPHGFNLRGVE